MHPFFFGSSKAPLYGVYHPPREGYVRGHGVVLCYPFGQEYMRGHRAFRQLALLLSREGFDVLRFDYSGTGDSGGESLSVDFERWVDDCEEAVDELRDMGDVSAVTLVGARLGAWVASSASARLDDVARVVLWDPIENGAGYLRDILGDMLAFGTDASDDPARVIAAVNGFPVTGRLHSQLKPRRLTLPPVPCHIVVSSARPELARLASDDVTVEVVPASSDWNEVDNFGSALLPCDVIQAVVRRVVGNA